MHFPEEPEDIPTVKEVIADDEFRESAWRGLNALDEVMHRILYSDLSPDQKRERALQAIDDFRDVFGDQTEEAIETITAELTRAASNYQHRSTRLPEVRGNDAPPTDGGTSLEDDEMKLGDLIAKLKPTADRLGLEIAEDADEAAVLTLLEAVPGKIPEVQGESPPETDREKELREELEREKGRNRRRDVEDAGALSRSLLERGAIDKEQKAILDKLLTAGVVKVALLSKEGEGDDAKEKVAEQEEDVGTLLRTFLSRIPAGAVTGRRVVVRDRDEAGKKDSEKHKQDVADVMSAAGADPETGVLGGYRKG